MLTYSGFLKIQTDGTKSIYVTENLYRQHGGLLGPSINRTEVGFANN